MTERLLAAVEPLDELEDILLNLQTIAPFTLGQNMSTLIMNKTCFTMKRVHIRWCSQCANHERNMFILGIVETTSWGGFDIGQTTYRKSSIKPLLPFPGGTYLIFRLRKGRGGLLERGAYFKS